MADYSQDGNRWTAIYLVEGDEPPRTYKKLPYELVRFNVDQDPEAPTVIVPSGMGSPGAEKIYEKIWIVDHIPWEGKVSFGATV